MKKFAFRLESALQWRLSQLKSSELLLQSMLAERATIESEIEMVRDEYRHCEDNTRADRECRGDTLAALSRYRLASLKAANALGLRLATLGSRLEHQTSAVLTARRDHELLVKLREKAVREWTIEHNRVIETEASEAFLIRWNQG